MIAHALTLRLSAADGNCALLTRGAHELTVCFFVRVRTVNACEQRPHAYSEGE